jgi:glutaredoxin
MITITIFYLEGCPHSLAALETLKKYNIKHEKIESSHNKEERQKHYPTFPQIYCDDKLIGGNDVFTNIIKTLQSNTVPSKQEEWTEREWCNFLLNITKKLK